MLNAELPDLNLDLSGLEMEPLDWNAVIDNEVVTAPADTAPATASPELAQPTAEEAPAKSALPGEEAKEEAEMLLQSPSAEWGAETEEAPSDSSFSYDYRTAALRHATMLDIGVENNDDNPDAFEGATGGAPAIEIVPATPDDIKEIIDLAADMVTCSQSPYRPVSEERLHACRRADMQSLYNLIKLPEFGAFVARDSRGRFVGHVLVNTGVVDFLTSESQAWIFDIAVQPKYWGSGISKRLLQQAETFARERGIRYIGLTVTTTNTRALRFYQKACYQEERYQMVKCLQPIELDKNDEPEDG